MGISMNFKRFQTIVQENDYDEVKVIGMDVEIDGAFMHIIAMTKSQKDSRIYILEETTPLFELGDYAEKTPRESMKGSQQEEHSFIKTIQVHECEITVKGEHSGPIIQGDYEETFLFLVKMAKQGWSISETSPFYQREWEHLGLRVMDVELSVDYLPDFDGPIEITMAMTFKKQLLEMPVKLEIGTAQEIIFVDDVGQEVLCYLNNSMLVDVLKKEKARFDDPDYRTKILQHCTQEELENMRQSVLETLERDCPEGMCYITIEYECAKNVSLQFYVKQYLDTIVQPSNQCTALFMRTRPDQENGPHGLKNRSVMIQYAVPKSTKQIDVELFMAMWPVPERTFVVKK